jgi:hypothetical protein
MFIKKIIACIFYGKKKAYSYISCYICGNSTSVKYYENLFNDDLLRCNSCKIK